MHEEQVLAAGGYWMWDDNGAFVTDTAEMYSPSTRRWSPTGRMNQPRAAFHMVNLPDGRILAAGGNTYAAAGYLISLNTAELYVSATGTWVETGHMSQPRQGMQMAVLWSGLVLAAGDAAPSELYDPATGAWTLTGSMVEARKNFDMVLLQDGNVLAAGGEAGDLDPGVSHLGPVLSSVELYNSTTGTWTTVSGLNVARAYLQMRVLPNGNVLAISGNTETVNWTITSTVEMFDGSSWSIVSPPSLPERWSALSLAVLANGDSIIFGGTYSLTPSDVFDYRTKKWWHAPPFPQAIGDFQVVQLQDKSVISAGGLILPDGTQTVGSTFVYAPSSDTIGAWSASGSMALPRYEHAMAVL
jgi:hypothetical protein